MKPRRNLLIGTLVVFALNQPSLAASLEWKGSTTGLASGTNNTWDTNTTANWWNGGSLVNWPALGGTDDDAVFGGTAGTVTITTATANDITFNTTGYTISGGTLTLNGGSTPAISNGTGINATISSVIAGSAGLTKGGAGALTLGGTNTYTGLTTVSAGTVVVQNNAALGANGNNITVASGATLDLGGNMAANGLNQGNRVFTISGSGVGGGGVLASTASNTQINAISKVVFAGDSTIGGPQRWDIRGNTPTLDMAGFNLTKTGTNYVGLVAVSVTPGAGNIVINQGELNITTGTNMGGSSSNSVTVNNGGTLGMYQSSVAPAWTLNLNTGAIFRGENGSAVQNIWNGPVNVAGDVTLRAEGSQNLTISGAIGNTGNINKNGAGNVILKGSNSFAGTTTVSEGTLTLDYGASDDSKLHDTSALIFNGGTVSLADGTHSESVVSTTLTAGSVNAVTVSSGAALLNLNTVTPGAGASLNFGADNIATTDNTNSNGILGTWATVGGNQWAVNSSGGADGLVTALTDFVYSFDLVNDNTFYQNKHVVVDSVQTPDAAINPLSLVFNTAFANSLTLQGTNTIATGGILVGTSVGNNTSALAGGNLTGPLNGDLTINQRNTANSLSIASAIVDNGTTHLLKTGPGLLLLTGTNTYSGITHIAAGSLQISSASAIGGTQVTTSGLNSASLLLGDGIVVPSSKSITIAGGGAGGLYGALSTASGNTGTSEWQGPVTIGALTETRIGTLGGTLLVSGNIGESAPGSQLLVRNNDTVNATTILSGNNTFSGGLQLIVGNLRMASANALGTGALTLGSGGNVNAFSSDGTTPRTISNPVVFNATTTHTLGDATLNGKLTFSGGANLGAANRTLGVASTVEFSNAIAATGAFGIIKTGVGDLILSAANTFTGATQINGGTVVVSHKDALATNSSVFASTTAGSGTLRLATDTSVVINRIETSSSNPGKIISDRATPGAGINHVIPAGWVGANTYTFEAGTNVTSGTAGITFNSLSLTAGSSSTAVLNPTTAVITIDGPVNIGLNNFAKTLRLDGTSSGNLISGVVSNGLNTLNISKTGTSTWTLSGDNTFTGSVAVSGGSLTLSGSNTFTGAVTVSGGSLTVSGNKTGNVGAITVSNTAGVDGVMNIQNGTYAVGGNNFIVGGAQTTPATGTVNQSGGVVSFTGGNGLLLGNAGTTASTGIYNLSGGSVNTGTAVTNRGVMLGANNNSINIFNLSGTGALNMTAVSGGTDTSVLHVGRFDSAANGTTNTFNQTGGTAKVAILSVGGNGATGSGISSTINWTGGSFIANAFPRMAAGNTNTATLTIGGTADVTLPAFPTARGTGSTATLYFDGGVLRPTATSGTYLEGLTAAYIKAGGVKFNTGAFNITVNQVLLTDPVSTGGGLTKEGTGTLSLTGNNTYTGGATLNQGTLNIAHANALGTGPFVNQTNTNTLANTSGAAVTLSNSSYTVSSSLIFGGSTAANDIHTGPGGFTLSGSQRILSVSGGVTVTIGGAMTGDLRKDGSGTLVLAGNSTALSGIRVTSGTVQMTGSTAAATSLIMGHPTSAGVGKFTLGGSGGAVNQTFASLSTEGSAQASQAVVGGNAAVSTLTINQSTSTTYAGVLGGAGSNENNLALTKAGSGTLSLTGSNTYTGNTSVTAGILSLGNGTANTGLANGADVSVASGATLNLNYSGTDIIDGLTINGVAKAPGIWGSASSGAPNIDPQLTGSGTLTVSTGPSLSAYDQWATVTYGLTGPNAAFDFDFDNDGIDNGLEWILGGNPTTNSAGILPLATRNLSGDLVLTFTREEDAIPETSLKVQFGTDLASWPKQATIGATSSGPDANGVTVSIDTVASPDAVTVTIPASNAPSGRIFARLNATQP